MTVTGTTPRSALAENIGVWFLAIKAGTGVDRFTESLAEALNQRGIRAEITWLPHRAEYLPWVVPVPECPEWANVVHVNSWLDVRFLPPERPCVVTVHSCVHDAAFLPYKSWLQSIYHRLWVFQQEARMLRRSVKAVAVSQYTATQTASAFQAQLEVIPNWVDTSVFKPSDAERSEGKFRLLFVGGLSKRKGMDLLPEIMIRLGNDYQLLYTGQPADFSQSLPSNMISLGRVNSKQALASVYQDADALLFPTRLEGMPLVVLEAMACGLPVVASDASSLAEVVLDHETGRLVPVDDIDGFVSAVIDVCGSPERHGEMSRQSISRIEKYFSESSLVGRYVDVYEQVLAGNASQNAIADTASRPQ